MKRTIFTLATVVALVPVAVMAQDSQYQPTGAMSVALAAHFDWSGHMNLGINAETDRNGNIDEINGSGGVAVSLISDIAVAAANGDATLATASSSASHGAQATAAATVNRRGSVSAVNFGPFSTNITAE